MQQQTTKGRTRAAIPCLSAQSVMRECEESDGNFRYRMRCDAHLTRGRHRPS